MDAYDSKYLRGYDAFGNSYESEPLYFREMWNNTENVNGSIDDYQDVEDFVGRLYDPADYE